MVDLPWGRRVIVGFVGLLLVGCGSAEDETDVTPHAADAATTSVDATMVVSPSTMPAVVEIDATIIEGMVLHLSDAPDGARIGDDSQCGSGISSEGDSDPFLDLVTETGGAVVGCLNQLEAPTVFVQSAVVAFPDDVVATRALAPAVFDGIIRYYALGCCTDTLPPPAEASDDGFPVVRAVSVADTVAIVGWRWANVVGAIGVVHMDGSPGALADAERLAAVQDARMQSPAPVPETADDDRLVGLDMAPFRTWWLGTTYAPPGLPTMSLFATYYREGMAELDYAGIRIEVFDLAATPPGSQSGQILGVAQELFDSPCTVSVPVEHEDGEAQLLGRYVPEEFFGPPSQNDGRVGWGALVDGECPIGDPNVWMATVTFDDGLLLRIDAPLCYNCLAPPDPERAYSQPDGLRAVIAGLVPYEPGAPAINPVQQPFALEVGTHCGVGRLGLPVDGRTWVTDEGVGEFDWMPDEWDAIVGPADAFITLDLVLSADRTVLTASANGRSVIYRPLSPDDPEMLSA